MMIADVIRKAESEEVVYLLLTSYIDAARSCDKLKKLPRQIATLPVHSKADVRSRFESLMLELDAASKRLDDDACVVVKEALLIFATAAYRLQMLGVGQSWPRYREQKTTESANFTAAFEQTRL